MSNDLSAFWRATWSAWRSGALSPISPVPSKISAIEYEDFLWTIAEPNNPFIGNKYSMLVDFFSEHPPRPNEFLIGASHKNGLMIITNQRLWMHDSQAGEYVVLNLVDVAECRIRPHFRTFDVTVLFKDGAERTYVKMAAAPSAQAVGLAVKLCESSLAGIVPAEPELSPVSNMEAGAALADIFSRHVSDQSPRILGVACWDTLGTRATTIVNEIVSYLPGALFGGLVGGPLKSMVETTDHRAGVVAVTETELFLVDLMKTSTADFTLGQLSGSRGTPQVARASLRNLTAEFDVRAGVLTLGGDMTAKLTFPTSISGDNHSKGLQMAKAIRAAIESPAASSEEWECEACGADISANDTVCPGCGARIES